MDCGSGIDVSKGTDERVLATLTSPGSSSPSTGLDSASQSSSFSEIVTTKCSLVFQDEDVAKSLGETYDYESLELCVKGEVESKEVQAMAAVLDQDSSTMQFNSVLECLQSICLNNFKWLQTYKHDEMDCVVFFNPVTNAICRLDLQEGFAPDGSYLNIQDQAKQHGYIPLESLNPALFDLNVMENIRGECLVCNGILRAVGIDLNLEFWAGRCRYCDYSTGNNPMMLTAACVWPGDDFARMVEVEDYGPHENHTVVLLKPLQTSYESAKEFASTVGPLVKWEGEEEKNFFREGRFIGKLKRIDVIKCHPNPVIAITAAVQPTELLRGKNYLRIVKVSVEIIPNTGFAVPARITTTCFTVTKVDLDPTHYYVHVLLEGGYEPTILNVGDAVFITPHLNDAVLCLIKSTLEMWWTEENTENEFMAKCLLDPKKMLTLSSGIINVDNLLIPDRSMRVCYRLMTKKLTTEELGAIDKCLTSGMSYIRRSTAAEANDIYSKILLALKVHVPKHTTLIIGATLEDCEAFTSHFKTIFNKVWNGISPCRILQVMSAREAMDARNSKAKSSDWVYYLHEKTDEIVRKGYNKKMQDIQQHYKNQTFWQVEEQDAYEWKKFIRKIERNQMESTKYQAIITNMECFAEYEMQSLFKNRARHIDSVMVLNAACIPQVQLVPLSCLKNVSRFIMGSFPINIALPQPYTKTGKLAHYSTSLIDCIN